MKTLLHRRWLLFLGGLTVLLILGGVAWWQLAGLFQSPARANPTGTSLTVDKAEWDFGVVRREIGMVRHDFLVSNHNPVPVRLSVKRLGCNCLSVDCPDEVPADGTATVTVKMEFRDREGNLANRVVLASTDPAVPELDLLLRCYVEPKVEIDPPVLRFTDVLRGQVLEGQVQLTIRESADQTTPPVLEPSGLPAGVKCELISVQQRIHATGEALRRFAYRFRVKLETNVLAGADQSMTRDVVRFQLKDSPEESRLAIPFEIYFRHHKGLKGQTSVTLSRGQPGNEIRIRLWSHDGKPFTIAKVSSSLTEVSARPAKTEAAAVQDVILTLGRGNDEKPSGLQKGFLEVHSPTFPDEPYRLEVLVLP